MYEISGIKHVSHNTSLYVSECLYDDFPGRVLRIDSIPDKRELKAIKGQKYNVVTRNYPVDVCVLRKKSELRREMINFFMHSGLQSITDL